MNHNKSTQIKDHRPSSFLPGCKSNELFADIELWNKERVIWGLIFLGPVIMLFGETIDKSGFPESLLSCLPKVLSAING